MTADSKGSSRNRERDIVVLYLTAAASAVGIFVLVAMVGPWLFNLQQTPAAVAAVAIWLVCPLLVFLGVRRLQARLRALGERRSDESPPS